MFLIQWHKAYDNLALSGFSFVSSLTVGFTLYPYCIITYITLVPTHFPILAHDVSSLWTVLL